ncbi:MAG: CHASE2 domain-containing protein, partial [Proteobacteria bacterium]|nr:CHASE2 domain-containing protein [Pseudomonadota bacterium]
MKGPTRIVLLAGLLATVAVLLAGMAGLLNRIEWWTQDQRFLRARASAEPMGDRVKLVAIDDRALDTIGRWPWSRDVLAIAFDEIARAGAKTVAVDVLFSDAQNAEADGALAKAIAKTPTVLSVNMDEGRLDTKLWGGQEGHRALEDLVKAIAEDITAEPADIATRAGLNGERRARFMERASQFKKLAAWKELVRMRAAGQAPSTAEAYRLILTKGDSSLDRFAERLLLDEAFDRDQAFASVMQFMAPGLGEGSAMDAPPIPALAAAAAGIGFVNSAADADGEYRRVRPFWPTPYGNLPQFGIAAAMLQLGVHPTTVTVEGNALVFPDGRRLPLEQGNVRIDWTTSVFESDPAGYRGQIGDTGVVAIGALVDLGRQRQVLASQEKRYRELGSDIASLQNLPASAIEQVPVDAKTRAAIKDQGEFLGGDLQVRGTADLKDATDDERRTVGLYREWWRLDKELGDSHRRIDAASAELRRQLEGRLVFVGWIATGVMADMINTVFGPRTPGVYFHAEAADMVLEWHGVSLMPPWSGWAVGAAWILGAGAWAFAMHDLMVPVAVPVLCAIASQAASVSTAAVVNQREKARITRQFRARVSPQLVDRLAADPNSLSMRGQQRTATILFGDLA